MDAEAVYGVLPVPLRLHANPHYRGRGVCIAFLDSGFHAHPDLVARRNRIRAYVDATTPDIVEHPSVEPAGELSWHGLMTTSASGDTLSVLLEARLYSARRAYACHPRSPWALIAGAWAAAHEGNLPEVRARLDNAVSAAPYNADVLSAAAGIAVLNADCFDEALLWGNRALELNETRPRWYRFPIGYAYLMKGDAAAAVKELQKGPQNYPELLAWQAGAAVGGA